jgi:hypothetical protein
LRRPADASHASQARSDERGFDRVVADFALHVRCCYETAPEGATYP